MQRIKLIIQNQRGVHTRAAAKVVDLAKQFESHIEICFNERLVDAKSIMGVITLGAQKNDTIELLIDGRDEIEAAESFSKLINDKFGEE